jgi:rSAM/selenodomain-associated transferase 2
MTISVVIPTLDEERSLPPTLTHTAGLGFDEVIVVDGGSRDRTREIVASYSSPQFDVRRSMLNVPTSNFEPRTHIKLLTAPPGRAPQMNAGAAASRGDVLLFLHADTLLPRDARLAIEGALEDPACVGGRFDVRFGRDSRPGRLIGRMINLRSRCTGIATGDQAIFVRRAVFERLGGFSDIPIMEDVDFTRRLKRAGRVAALRSQVVTSYRRWDACGPIRTILLMWVLRLLYWIGVSPGTLSRFYSTVR